MIKLSIVVPVYNVESYLDRCINSLIKQDASFSYEILLVDDGSTDNSGAICDSYAERYDKISVIHQKNQGLGPARNTGLEYARGQYIGFVDSDDWVEPTMYKSLLQEIENHAADIAACNFFNANAKTKQIAHREKVGKLVLNREDSLKYLARSQFFAGYMWNKLYKRELFARLRFQNFVSEDALMNCELMLTIDKLVYIDLPLYNYYKRSGSILNSKYNLKKLTEIEVRKLMYEKVGAVHPALAAVYFARYAQTVIQHAVQLIGLDEYKHEYAQLERFLMENKREIMRNEFLEKRFKKHCARLTGPQWYKKLFYNVRGMIKSDQ